MYEGDSFFTLTLIGRIGLVLLSAGLAALTAAVFIKTTCRLAWLLRLLLAPVYLWVFVWLSPQVFYLYYMALFDHLPPRNVAQMPPQPSQIIHLLGFSGKAALSHHATGLLGWGLIVLAWFGERAVPSARLRAVLGL
ncbi:hypothetical protein [Anderseniella sp. Alg231-50]|uniref:hypothetical protein n=1 Tax=Anderseniella sp. Alg231-50 TaxID=1922226 RepID=UPI000D54E3AC